MVSRGRLVALAVLGGIGLFCGVLTGMVRPEEPSPVAGIELRSERITESADRSPARVVSGRPGPAAGASDDGDAPLGGRRERIDRDDDGPRRDDDGPRRDDDGDDDGPRRDDDGDDDGPRLDDDGDDDGPRGDDASRVPGSDGDDDRDEGTTRPASPSSAGEDDVSEGGADSDDEEGDDEGDDDEGDDDEGGDD